MFRRLINTTDDLAITILRLVLGVVFFARTSTPTFTLQPPLVTPSTATNTPVLFAAVDIPLEVAEPIKSVDEPVVVQLKQAPIMAIKPTGEEVQLAQVVTPPPAEVAATVAVAPEQELPKTASPYPLIGLFGLLALSAAFTIHVVARRV